MLFRGGEFEMTAVCVRRSISYKFRDKSADLTGGKRTGPEIRGLWQRGGEWSSENQWWLRWSKSKGKKTGLETSKSRSHSEKRGPSQCKENFRCGRCCERDSKREQGGEEAPGCYTWKALGNFWVYGLNGVAGAEIWSELSLGPCQQEAWPWRPLAEGAKGEPALLHSMPLLRGFWCQGDARWPSKIATVHRHIRFSSISCVPVTCQVFLSLMETQQRRRRAGSMPPQHFLPSSAGGQH